MIQAEQAVVVAHATVMIYDDVNKKWVQAGCSSGLAKVQIYHHQTFNTFRVVGRKVNDHEVSSLLYVFKRHPAAGTNGYADCLCKFIAVTLSTIFPHSFCEYCPVVRKALLDALLSPYAEDPEQCEVVSNSLRRFFDPKKNTVAPSLKHVD